MPLPGGDDHWRALRPRPANCSPAMIIACGSGSSLSMHSETMRRATRFVDATRGTTASDSMRFRCATMRLVSRSIIASLVLLQLLDPRAQFRRARPRLLDHRGRRVAHELLVRPPCLGAGELVAALLQLALRPFLLLLRHDLRRELDGDGEALNHVVLRPLGSVGADEHRVEARQLRQQVLVVTEERRLALRLRADVELESILRRAA